eukprot:11916246-Alexandrium_andersonii.AAC.1
MALPLAPVPRKHWRRACRPNGPACKLDGQAGGAGRGRAAIRRAGHGRCGRPRVHDPALI